MYYVAQDLGSKLRNIRETHGITQSDLSRRTGIAVSNISLIENGKTERPTTRTLDKLASALGVAPSELYTSDDMTGDRLDMLERRIDVLYDLVDRVEELERHLTPSEARAEIMRLAEVHGRDELIRILQASENGESTQAPAGEASSTASA